MKVIFSSRAGVILTFILLTASAAYPNEEDPDVLDLGSSGNCSNGNCDDNEDDEPKCPPDSTVDPADGTCICTFRHCVQPICRSPSQRVLRRKGTKHPGDCCDIYECVSSHEKNCSEVICPEEVEKCPDDSYRLPAHKSPEDCCSTPQSCQCLPIECDHHVCPKGQRPRIVREGNSKPGTCCPLIDCVPDLKTNDSCLVNDSQIMANGTTWQKDPCTYCSCLNGYLFCNASNSPNCPENPAGCMSSSGKLYENGDAWEDDPCTQCVCENGEKKCTAYMCGVSCVNPRHVPGTCCPVCDDSSVVSLPPHCPSLEDCPLRCLHGFVIDEAGCFTCKCQAEPCLLECEHGFVHDSKGHMLCECSEGEATAVTATTASSCELTPECKKHCSWGNFNKAECEKCKCKSDVCKPMTDCRKLCPDGFAADKRGCPVCKCIERSTTAEMTTIPSEKNRATSCFSSDGSVHEDGDSWHDGCRQCLCHSGVEMCNLVICPRLNCINPVFNSTTDCCATCPDDTRPASTTFKTVLCHTMDGEYKQEGETWSIGSCSKCMCHKGQTLCETRQCPPTPCPNPVTDSEHCCPYCPQIPSFEESEGKPCSFARPHGSVWRQSNCESCKCDNGQAICYKQECEIQKCQHPVMLKHQCCSICIENALKESCRVGNATYQNSEEWVEDDCTKCMCNDGHRMCTKQMCPPHYCDNPIRNPGRCCPICPDPGENSSFGTSPVKMFIYNIIITILALVILSLIICILILCRRSRRYCVSCPDSECLAPFTTLSKPKYKYDSSQSDYTTEKAKLASV